jgi:uncharacterized protein (DUF1697 family)
MPPVETWAVLLRGINVGGKAVIPMADLRDLFASMGYTEPQTYIQSGNVIVGAKAKPTPRALTAIERRLSETFGYQARVVVRTLPEMRTVIRQIPADWDAADKTTRFYVLFPTDRVRPRDLVASVTPKPDVEALRAGTKAVYWSAPFATLTRTSMSRFTQHPMYPEVTIRNLNTTLKLLELMQAR